VVALKGRWPPPIGAAGDSDGGPLPAGWRIEAVRTVVVPGLDEARHQVLLRHGGGVTVE
jgi:hypothetical protein